MTDPAAALDALVGFVDRSRRLVVVARLCFGAALAVGLAWLANRVDAPLGVGACGLVVVGPLLWLGTGVLVPMALLSREPTLRSQGLSLHAGVPVTLDERGLSAGTQRIDWVTAHAPADLGASIVVRGVDRERRRVFQLILGPQNFASASARREVLTGLERLRQAAIVK